MGLLDNPIVKPDEGSWDKKNYYTFIVETTLQRNDRKTNISAAVTQCIRKASVPEAVKKPLAAYALKKQKKNTLCIWTLIALYCLAVAITYYFLGVPKKEVLYTAAAATAVILILVLEVNTLRRIAKQIRMQCEWKSHQGKSL